jgi:hypothetical protein
VRPYNYVSVVGDLVLNYIKAEEKSINAAEPVPEKTIPAPYPGHWQEFGPPSAKIIVY